MGTRNDELEGNECKNYRLDPLDTHGRMREKCERYKRSQQETFSYVNSLEPLHRPCYGGVAQSVEQGTHKPCVTGSIPVAATTTHTPLLP